MTSRLTTKTAIAASAIVAFVCACGNVLGIDSASRAPAPHDALPSPEPPSAEAGSPEQADACLQTETNSKHCGACGHDCLGGACVAGVCAPSVAVRAVVGVNALSVSETHLAWQDSEATGIGVCNLPGCDRQTFVRTSVYPLEGVTAVAPYLYWASLQPYETDAGTMQRLVTARCRTEACAATIEMAQRLVPVFASAGLLIAQEGMYERPLVRCNLPEDTSCKPLSLGRTTDYEEIIGVAGGRIFYSMKNDGDHALASCVDTDCDATRVIHAARGLGKAIVRDPYVAFVRAGMLSVCLGSDCKNTTRDLAAMTSDFDLALDDDTAYVLSRDARSLSACALSGCDSHPRTIATGLGLSRRLAANARALYYHDPAQGAIMRVVP